ncbi:hypothetical protein AAAC51_36840 [Priestia megaterium]
MSKKQRVERIFREKEVRHYIKPYIMYMTYMIRTIFNLVYNLKKPTGVFSHILLVATGSNTSI